MKLKDLIFGYRLTIFSTIDGYELFGKIVILLAVSMALSMFKMKMNGKKNKDGCAYSERCERNEKKKKKKRHQTESFGMNRKTTTTIV